MSDVTDSQKVAQKINKLIKDKYSTNEKLAEYLNMSPAAVNKNLSGKANFDNEKLNLIAKFFNIPSEELFLQKTKAQGEVSLYEEAALKGEKAIKELIAKGGSITSADVFGKYLAEYIAENDNKKAFLYVAQKGGLNIEKGAEFDRAMINIICYGIKISHATEEIFDYYFANGGLLNNLEKDLILKLFEAIQAAKKYEIIEYLLNKTVKLQKVIFKYIKLPYTQKALSLNFLAEIIAEGKLDGTIDWSIDKFDSYKTAVLYFIGKKYNYGFDKFYQKLSKEGVQNILVIDKDYYKEAVKHQNLEVIKTLLKISDENCDEYISLCLNYGYKEGYDYIYSGYNKKLNISLLSRYSIKYKRYDFFKGIKGLSKDDYDIALSLTPAQDNDMNLYILKKGGEFNQRYFGGDTQDKINSIIGHLLKE